MVTSYNSEHLVSLRCTQIALRATSGICGTLCVSGALLTFNLFWESWHSASLVVGKEIIVYFLRHIISYMNVRRFMQQQKVPSGIDLLKFIK